jgi:hypothetical protein
VSIYLAPLGVGVANGPQKSVWTRSRRLVAGRDVLRLIVRTLLLSAHVSYILCDFIVISITLVTAWLRSLIFSSLA